MLDWINEAGLFGWLMILSCGLTLVAVLPLLLAFRERFIACLYFLTAMGPLLLGAVLSVVNHVALARPVLAQRVGEAEVLERIWDLTLRTTYLGAMVTLPLIVLGIWRLARLRAAAARDPGRLTGHSNPGSHAA